MNFPLPLHPDELAHCRRTAALSKLLAEFAGYSEEAVRTITQSALVHDIGKAAIPEAILHKPGPLSSSDYAIIRTHTTIGAQTLVHTRATMNTAAIVALQHHERLDGSGYFGLRGAEIHPHARLVAVADVFDALVTSRPYKKPWPLSHVCTYLKERSGKQFDAEIVALLLNNIDRAMVFYSNEKAYIGPNTHFSRLYAQRERGKQECCYKKNSISSIG
ncbi:MAG: HD-GYP domain-containing protein [Eubacteriales bacterium]|nr:HD-GYP domain-containing protein [Eubacteriales bacterium]